MVVGFRMEAPLLLYEFLPPSQQLNHHQLPSGLPAPLLVADVMGGSDPFLDTPIPPIYPSHPPPRSIIENSPRWMRVSCGRQASEIIYTTFPNTCLTDSLTPLISRTRYLLGKNQFSIQCLLWLYCSLMKGGLLEEAGGQDNHIISLVIGIEGICHGLNNGRQIKGESHGGN